MADNVCPVCDDGQENAIRAEHRIGPAPAPESDPSGVPWDVSGEGGLPVWFYIPAVIVIALLAFLFIRSNVFRNRLRAHDPVHDGRSSSDPVGDIGLYGGGGGGGGN